MSSQQKGQQWSLVGGAIVVGLILVFYLYLASSRRSEKKEGSTGVSKHTVTTSAEETLKYWTPERMRKAKPAPMPVVDDVKEEKKQS